MKILKSAFLALGNGVIGTILLTMPTMSPLSAAPIPGLFTTGVDDSGNALPLGSVDPHYTILDSDTNPNAFVLSSIPDVYVDNNSTSQWIWEEPNGTPTDVTRTFRTTFNLTGLDPNTALISGTWAVDNIGVDILINGVSTGQTIPFGFPAFQSFTSFSITEGFVSGLNTLDFVVEDQGVVSGFRVGQISGTAEATSVPEPTSTLGLLVLGAIGLGSALKKQSGVSFRG